MSTTRGIAAVALVVAVLATPLGADDGESGFDPVQKYPNMPPDYVPDVFATAETNHLRYYQVGVCPAAQRGAPHRGAQTNACMHRVLASHLSLGDSRSPRTPTTTSGSGRRRRTCSESLC